MFHPDSSSLTDVEQVDEIIFQAMSAQDAYHQMDQESIDWIVGNMARVGASNHLSLAKMAVNETERGIVEDKSITNIFASSGLEGKLKALQTVGTIEEDSINGQQISAEPVGILAAFPASNQPTAATLLQAILSVKTRNPIIFCFPPSGKSSAMATAQLMKEAAVKAGAPAHAIQWLPVSSEKSISTLSNNPEVSLLLVDEDDLPLLPQPFPDVPILGMGQCNTPCLIDRSADIEKAATDIIASKHFDNGLCATSEQTVIISREVYFQTLDLLMQKSCHLASEKEKEQLEQFLFDPETAMPNSDCTGRSAVHIAEMAGFTVPANTKLIVTEIGGIGVSHPLSRSKAVPVLSILAADSWYEGLCFCEAVLEFGSAFHTAVLHARDKELSEEFATRLKVSHSILNQPATRGDLCQLIASANNTITSASDRQAGNPSTALLSVDMLLHRKLIQKPHTRLREWKVPDKVIFAQGCINQLQTLTGIERTLIVTEKELLNSSQLNTIQHLLTQQNHSVETESFSDIQQLVSVESIEQGVECMKSFQPTALLAIGNEASIDTAKAIRYFYQRPESSFPGSSPNFQRADFPDCPADQPQRKVTLIALPTTPGAGFHINPFVTIFNKSREKRRSLHSCELLPDVSFIDPVFATAPGAKEMALTGLSILHHALEAYVSPLASDYSDPMAMKAIQTLFEYLPKAVARKQAATREKIYNAASLAGMAAGNAKLGLGHAMVHSLKSFFKLPSGMAGSLLLPHIIRYNGVEDPSRFNPLAVHSRYIAHERYQEIAGSLGLACKSPEQAVESLTTAISRMQRELGVPSRLGDCDISAEDYQARIEQMAEQAFEDHSAATNPRLPMIQEIIDIYDELY